MIVQAVYRTNPRRLIGIGLRTQSGRQRPRHQAVASMTIADHGDGIITLRTYAAWVAAADRRAAEEMAEIMPVITREGSRDRVCR